MEHTSLILLLSSASGQAQAYPFQGQSKSARPNTQGPGWKLCFILLAKASHMTECKVKGRQINSSPLSGKYQKVTWQRMGIQGGSILCTAIVCMHICLHMHVHRWAACSCLCMRVYSCRCAQVPFHMYANVCVAVYMQRMSS